MYLNIENISSIDNALNESSDTECSICLENITNKYTILKCNHVFHANCIKTWLKTHMECPMCRTYLKEYYDGSVFNKNKLKFGIKFNLILNDDKFIIKYYYRFTNILKKRLEIPIIRIKYFSHSGKFFTYNFLDDNTRVLKEEILYINHNGAEHLFCNLKKKINKLMCQNKEYEDIAEL